MNRITSFGDTAHFGRMGMDARPLADRAVPMVVPVMMVMVWVVTAVVTKRDEHGIRGMTKFTLGAWLSGVLEDRMDKRKAHGSHIAAQSHKTHDSPLNRHPSATRDHLKA